MCGLVGVIGAANRVSRPQFLQMRDTIAHRGPDDAGVWESSSGNVMLGSRRLAILDLSPSGHQPMEDKQRGLVIAFNGEIYNYIELASELSSLGCRFRSRTDTEVLLESYATWGTHCLECLNGMFAFAIWDEDRQELFAARDRFGEKPLYFFHDASRELMAFASEIKSLVAGRFFSPVPDRNAVCAFLAGESIDAGTRTIFKDVFALPAAHALRYSPRDRSLKTWRYWDLNPENEVRLPDDRSYAERFLHLLSDSVRLRLRSDVPMGSSLSGGLDSSTIVGLIARERPDAGQETFSARFTDPRLDEGPHIQRMAAWAGVRNHATYPDPNALAGEMENLTWHQDAPFASSSVYAQWCVMRLARDCGITVLQDGQGGDEVLAGYHSYFGSCFAQSIKQVRFVESVRTICAYTAQQGVSQLPLAFVSAFPLKVRSSLKKVGRPLAIQRGFAGCAESDATRGRPKFGHSLHQALYETLMHTSLPHLLRYADRNSMAFSREVRLPFLDHRLVEFMLAIPPGQKIDGATTKAVLRNATKGILPEEIRNRKDKLGFAPPEAVWLRGPLRRWVSDVFQSSQFRQREWIDRSAFDRLWKGFENGRNLFTGIIWRWLSLEIWARTCLSARAMEPRPSLVSTAMPALALQAPR